MKNKKLLCIILVLAFVCVFTACSKNEKNTSSDIETNTQVSDEDIFIKPNNYSYVLVVTINPQFKLYLDNDDNVLAVEALNKDAEEIIELITFENKDVENVVQQVVTVANEKGFIKEDATVKFIVEDVIDANVNTTEVLDKVKTITNDTATELNISVVVNTEVKEMEEAITEEPTTEEATTEEPTMEEATTEEPTTEEVTTEEPTKTPIVDEAPVVDIPKEIKSYEVLYHYIFQGKYNDNNEEDCSFWCEYGYDERGNLNKNIEHSGDGITQYSYESTWEYFYDDNGNLIHEIEYKDNGNMRNESYYDGKGNRYKHIFHRDDGTASITEEIFEYDKYGRVIKSQQKMIENDIESEWVTWLIEYDKYNNVIKRSHYDENGKFLDASGFEYIYVKGWNSYWVYKVYSYNSEGEIIKETVFDYEFDENGYIIKQKYNDGSILEYIYNEEGIPIRTMWYGSNSYSIDELICVTIKR